MQHIRVNGIILNKKKINDNDSLMYIFTKEYGKIVAIYFGINKSIKKEKLSIDNFSYTEFILRSKKNLLTNTLDNIVAETNLINAYPKIKKNIYKLNYIIYVSNVINKVCLNDTKEEKIFDRTLQLLEYIENIKDEYIDNLYKLNIFIVFYLLRTIKDIGLYDISEIISHIAENITEEKEIENTINKIYQYIKNMDNNIEIDGIKRLILKLEKYINHHLDTNINYQKIIFINR